LRLKVPPEGGANVIKLRENNRFTLFPAWWPLRNHC
jgi:hypothetical protein